MKKSTQERLALKILIDRPKARNEVRGSTVVVVINACCLSVAVSVLFCSACLPAYYQSLLIPVFIADVSRALCLYECLCL